MNCKQYRTEIEAADFTARRDAAHAASHADVARTASHADGCAECRDFRDETAALRGLVAGLARIDAPPDFEFRLRSALAAADAAQPRAWSQNLRAQNLWPRAAWLAAAGGLALAAALALQMRGPQPTGARATPAEQSIANTAATQAAEQSVAITVTNESTEAASRGENVEGIDGVRASELTGASLEVNEPLVTQRRVRDAASAARQAQRRFAAAVAAAAQSEGETLMPGGAGAAATETRTMSMSGSSVVVTSSIPLPISADERPLQVLFRDTQGASRVVNVDPVAFGSNEPAARPANVTFTKAAKKQGVW